MELSASLERHSSRMSLVRVARVIVPRVVDDSKLIASPRWKTDGAFNDLSGAHSHGICRAAPSSSEAFRKADAPVAREMCHIVALPTGGSSFVTHRGSLLEAQPTDSCECAPDRSMNAPSVFHRRDL